MSITDNITPTSIPKSEVDRIYPLGRKIKLTRAAVGEMVTIWKPMLAAVDYMEFEVLDHYYEVGSRKQIIGATIVGTPYLQWRNLASSVHGIVPNETYGQLRGLLAKAVNCHGDVRNYRLLRPGRRGDEDKKSMSVLVLTKWSSGRYDEEDAKDSNIIDVSQDLFSEFF